MSARRGERRDVTTADLGALPRILEPPAEKQSDPEPSAEPSDERSDLLATSLLPRSEAERLRERWRTVQAGFVDAPRLAVEEADRLVAELMQRLAAAFSETRAALEARWDGRGEVSTEELRVALTHYRSFFERLLAGHVHGDERPLSREPEPRR